MKQLDFLLLGIDHLVNTYNIIRRSAPKASFTIFPVIVDSGYEGPQASLNNLADFCSIARIPGFTLTNACDAQAIMAAHLVSPGFRIITASQRLFKTEIIDTKALFMNPARTVFQYSDGPAATIVCFNFSFPQGMELNERFKQKGLKASLFTINASTPTDWEQVIANVKTTKNLVLIEDSKSENAPWQSFLIDVLEQVKLENKIIIRRDMSGYYPRPHADQVIVDYDAVINRFLPSQAMR